MEASDYLKKHRVKKEHGFTEYDNAKATIIASMDGCVVFNEEFYHRGKSLSEMFNPNK